MPVCSGVNVAVRVSFMLGLVVVLESIRTEHYKGARAQTERDQCEAAMKPELFSEAHQITARRIEISRLARRPIIADGLLRRPAFCFGLRDWERSSRADKRTESPVVSKQPARTSYATAMVSTIYLPER